jgi:DNA polymerase V
MKCLRRNRRSYEMLKLVLLKPHAMKAIVDCNSFYCSCERVFRPDLENKPVVVLSNNDGCIISISNEAKAFGIDMAVPYYQVRDAIEQNGIHTFSSNYNLYGDLSRRVMETLKALVGEENVEVYSVDEAFLDLAHIPKAQLHECATHIRETVEQWTGVSVSVGIGATKVLSKVANRLSKKLRVPSKTWVLDTEEATADALQRTLVKDLWGIGGRYAKKLMEWNIHTAWELKHMNEEWARTHLGGVVGVRMIEELNGKQTIKMEKPLVNKKMIATTRMFGTAVTDLKDIKEAIATYTTRAAEKLRRQHSAASAISVFVIPKQKSGAEDYRHGGYPRSSYVTLPSPTSLTQELIKPAMAMAEKIYREGERYSKAGVTLSGLVPDSSIQANLFKAAASNQSRWLMEMLDNINFSMRNDIIRYAASGTEKNWKMRQDFISPRYTTRWNELREVT